MNNNEKLASEVWDELSEYMSDKTDSDDRKRGIDTIISLFDHHSGQAVDRQEWTHEKLQGLLQINNEDRYVADSAFENTLDEINAALAAERKKIENLHKILGEKRELIKAERQRAEQAESFLSLSDRSKTADEIKTLREQLLSALAAIEKTGEATEKAMAANQMRGIHQEIQSSMEAARHTPEYEQESRELNATGKGTWNDGL